MKCVLTTQITLRKSKKKNLVSWCLSGKKVLFSREDKNMAKANAIVAQSGGPTCVINSSVCGVIQEAKKSKKIGKVLAAHNGILGVLKEDLFDVYAENRPQLKR